MRVFVYLFFVIFISVSSSFQELKAQQYNAYQFIEPNVAISYDSNYFKMAKRYSYLPGGNEVCYFNLKKENIRRTLIEIRPSFNKSEHVNKVMLDSFMQARMKEFKNEKSNGFLLVSYDTIPLNISGFLCMGAVFSDMPKKHFTSAVICNHISENDMTSLMYTSLDNAPLKNNYMTLKKFLAGFISYSPQQIATHDSMVRTCFKITLTQTQKQHTDTTVSVKNGMTEYHIENYNYEALVKVKSISPTAYKVKEIRAKSGSPITVYAAIILSNNGDRTIAYHDPKKGLVSGSGEVIVTAVGDKDVTIPFTFSYTNE